MKNHLKSRAAPKTWMLGRKRNAFTLCPTGSGHPRDLGLPLGLILRDVLKQASTTNEIRKLLNTTEVLIDEQRRKDYRFQVGLFDVLSIPALKKKYRLSLDRKGRIIVKEVQGTDILKPCRIIGKRVLPQGKIQYNLHDGKNLISEITAKVGDTLLLRLPGNQVEDIYPLQTGATVFFIKGKHSGELGALKEIKRKEVVYVAEGKEVQTAKQYAFVLGKQKPCIEV